jgi:DNA primase large subunit
MLTAQELQALMNQPHYGWNTLTLLGDVEDFLDFSEASIDSQSRRESRRVAAECDGHEFEDPLDGERYREQRLEGVDYRFKISLTQRVRYSGLTSLITSIEWSLIVLKKRANFAVPKKPKRVNAAVHLLTVFANQAKQDLSAQIELLTLLVQVRNCVVHSAGRIESYEFADELRRSLNGHNGIKLSNINFLGESIEISQGYLQGVLERAKHWLPALEKVMHERGLLQ